MSTQVILGKPGAGKSYEAVQRAYDAVAAGRLVITNLPLKLSHEFWQKALEDNLLMMVKSTSHATEDETDHFGHIDGWKDIIEGSKELQRELTNTKGDEASVIGPLVIVDEGMVTFQAMIRNKRKSDDWATLGKFFAVHRHLLIDVLVMFHDHGQVDPQLKQVVERWHHVINTTEMTGMNTFTVGLSSKGFVSGQNYMSKRSGKFKKEIYALYDSYAEGSGAGVSGKKSETGLKRSRPIWLRPWFVLCAVLGLVVLPVAGVKTVKGIKGATTIDDNAVEFGGAIGGSKVSGVPVLSEAEILALQARSGVAGTVTNPHAAKLGWPDPSISIVGFDNETVYFQDGQRLNLYSDIEASPFSVVEILLCRVTLAGVVEKKLELIEYTCAKGN